ncbi:MAG: septum formation initiator family protein [Candidatus Dormibacteraeota bacterium]|nr:septum formation initiator family protein [Candidatus Dormibacteraeota bacterium]
MALVVIGVWMAVAFLQEVRFTRDLSSQAAGLRRQNAAITGQNGAYRHDIAASASGAAAEEEARQNGYSRPGEKVYIVAGAPAASPPPAPVKTTPTGPTSGRLKALSTAIWAWLTG